MNLNFRQQIGPACALAPTCGNDTLDICTLRLESGRWQLLRSTSAQICVAPGYWRNADILQRYLRQPDARLGRRAPEIPLVYRRRCRYEQPGPKRQPKGREGGRFRLLPLETVGAVYQQRHPEPTIAAKLMCRALFRPTVLKQRQLGSWAGAATATNASPRRQALRRSRAETASASSFQHAQTPAQIVINISRRTTEHASLKCSWSFQTGRSPPCSCCAISLRQSGKPQPLAALMFPPAG